LLTRTFEMCSLTLVAPYVDDVYPIIRGLCLAGAQCYSIHRGVLL